MLVFLFIFNSWNFGRIQQTAFLKANKCWNREVAILSEFKYPQIVSMMRKATFISVIVTKNKFIVYYPRGYSPCLDAFRTTRDRSRHHMEIVTNITNNIMN